MVSHRRVSCVRPVVALCAATVLFAPPTDAQTVRASAKHAVAPATSLTDSVVVTDAWARPALKGGTGGAYMIIENRGHRPIRIVSATSPVAMSTELHESTIHNGVAHMQMLPGLLIAPGRSVSLKPGAMHYMLLRLRNGLEKGDTTQLTLMLQDAESQHAEPQHTAARNVASQRTPQQNARPHVVNVVVRVQ